MLMRNGSSSAREYTPSRDEGTSGRYDSTSVEQLGIRRQTPVGAGSPGEPLQHQFTRVTAHPASALRVAQQLGEPFAQFFHVARLNQETGDAMLNHLGEGAQAAADHWRTTRHRLQQHQPQELRNRQIPPITGPLDGRKRQDRCLAIERWEIRIRHWPKECNIAAGGKAMQQSRIITFRWVRIVTGRSGDPQGRPWRKGFDQTIDSLGGGKAADEEHPVPPLGRIGRKPDRIGTTVDHPCTVGGKAEFTRGIGRYGQEAIEQLWKQTGPGATLKAMIGDDDALTAKSRGYHRDAAGHAPKVMRVNNVGTRERGRKRKRHGMGRMTVEKSDGPECPAP